MNIHRGDVTATILLINNFQYALTAVVLLGGSRTGIAAPAAKSTRLVESPLSSANLIETALGLFVVLAIMLAIAWLVKRYVHVPGVGKGQVQVLGGVSLGAREKAVLLTVEGRRLLVGVAPGRVQTLIELDHMPQPVDEASADFAEQLQAASSTPPSTPGRPA